MCEQWHNPSPEKGPDAGGGAAWANACSACCVAHAASNVSYGSFYGMKSGGMLCLDTWVQWPTLLPEKVPEGGRGVVWSWSLEPGPLKPGTPQLSGEISRRQLAAC